MLEGKLKNIAYLNTSRYRRFNLLLPYPYSCDEENHKTPVTVIFVQNKSNKTNIPSWMYQELVKPTGEFIL